MKFWKILNKTKINTFQKDQKHCNKMVLINLPFMGQYIASHVISPFIKRESPSLMMIYNSQLINDYYFSLKGCTVRWLERTNMKKVLVFQMERYYLLTKSAKPYLTCDLIDISWFDNLKSFWTWCFCKVFCLGTQPSHLLRELNIWVCQPYQHVKH